MKLSLPLLLISLGGLSVANADGHKAVCNVDGSTVGEMRRRMLAGKKVVARKSFEERVLRGGRQLQTSCPAGDCTSILKHHPDGETAQGNAGIACAFAPDEGPNYLGEGSHGFGRCFDATNSGCTAAVYVDSVSFWIEILDQLDGSGNGVDVSVTLYKSSTSDCTDVASIFSGGTVVATEAITLTPVLALEKFTVPITTEVILDVTDALYVEYSVENTDFGSLRFWPGSTTQPDCDETYLRSNCGGANPVPLSFFGLPNNHYLIDVETTPVPVDPGAKMDPHFKTWTGTYFDFMGECDLILLEAPSFGGQTGKDLTIQIRTKIEYEYSYIESAVVKIGDEILEVGSFGDYFLNGVVGGKLPGTLSGFATNHTQINKKKHLFTVDLGNHGEAIEIRTFKNWVSVSLNKPSKARYQDSRGMMGEFGTGKLLSRDGVTVFEDVNAFASEWQVRDTDSMLFESIRAPQYPQKCHLPTPAQKASRHLGESSISYEAAKMACTTAGADNMEGCIHDVMATGDLELADAGAF